VDLRPTTRALYRVLLEKWLIPAFEDVAIGKLSTVGWRRWFTTVSTAHPGSLQPRKAYKLARAILNTAVEDGLIAMNPCRIKGAGKEVSPERPIATIEQVYAIAGAIDPQYRCFVLLGAFASLRYGEVSGLRRRHVDLGSGTINVTEQAIELADGSTIYGPPKTDAGRRMVAIPALLVVELEQHLSDFVGPDLDALLFTAPQGGPLRRTKFRWRWLAACESAGVEGLHYHDLRHTGATLAARAGATIAELMNRLGHASPAVAMRYQHAVGERDKALAAAMNAAICASQNVDAAPE
jgi:integrase